MTRKEVLTRKEALKVLEEVLKQEEEILTKKIRNDANPLCATRPGETKAQWDKTFKLRSVFDYFGSHFQAPHL